MPRPVATTVLLFTLAHGLPAAPQIPARPQEPPDALAAKLASPFLQRADWTTDLDAAMRRASARQQPILGYFTTTGP